MSVGLESKMSDVVQAGLNIAMADTQGINALCAKEKELQSYAGMFNKTNQAPSSSSAAPLPLPIDSASSSSSKIDCIFQFKKPQDPNLTNNEFVATVNSRLFKVTFKVSPEQFDGELLRLCEKVSGSYSSSLDQRDVADLDCVKEYCVKTGTALPTTEVLSLNRA